MGVSVLYVCTGNVCRSPMAELLFRSWANQDADLHVTSAGTQALVGAPIDSSSASALGQLGIDPGAHRARQFEPWMAVQADLVLTAEVAHREQVMTEVPAAFRRTFTMKEFARLARHLRPGEWPDVIAEAAAIRGVDGAVLDGSDDMPDPYRDAISRAKTIAQQITDTVHATVGALGLWPHNHAIPVPVAAAVAPARRPRPRPR